jgi:hypothetical protein
MSAVVFRWCEVVRTRNSDLVTSHRLSKSVVSWMGEGEDDEIHDRIDKPGWWGKDHDRQQSCVNRCMRPILKR